MRNIEELLAELSKEQLAILQHARRKAPVKMIKLAKKLGLRVFEATIPMRRGAPMAGALRTGDQTYEGKDGYWIECHRDDSETRKRFTVAHEIGHYLFHKHIMTDDIEDNALYHSDLSDSRGSRGQQIRRLATDARRANSRIPGAGLGHGRDGEEI